MKYAPDDTRTDVRSLKQTAKELRELNSEMRLAFQQNNPRQAGQILLRINKIEREFISEARE